MNSEQITLVKDSWAQVIPIQEQAAALFYQRLFELDPSLKAMFKSDIVEQGKLLMKMITTAVNALDRLDTIVPAVKNLGQRHAGYGVKPEHYTSVATALLWTLEQGLGAAFTPTVKDAWVETYTILATTMQSGGAAPAAGGSAAAADRFAPLWRTLGHWGGSFQRIPASALRAMRRLVASG